MLGRHLECRRGPWRSDGASLDVSEAAMLARPCHRAKLDDDQQRGVTSFRFARR